MLLQCCASVYSSKYSQYVHASGTLFSPVHAQNWLLTCHVNGDAVSCPPHAHSGDHVTFNLKANQFEGYVLWKLPNGSCQGSKQPDTIVLSTTRGDCRRKRGFCGPFNATNIDPGHGSSCFQNNLSVIINSNSTHVIILEYGIQELNSNIIPVNSTEIHIHSGGKTRYIWSVHHINMYCKYMYSSIVEFRSIVCKPIIIIWQPALHILISFYLKVIS